jgi:hypothetical protein
MHKITQNPPPPHTLSPYASPGTRTLHDAAERALNHYFGPASRPSEPPEKPASHVFSVIPNQDTETLLIHASQTLAAVDVMSTDLAFELEGKQRHVALAIQQMVSLGALLVEQTLERIDQPRAMHLGE